MRIEGWAIGFLVGCLALWNVIVLAMCVTWLGERGDEPALWALGSLAWLSLLDVLVFWWLVKKVRQP